MQRALMLALMSLLSGSGRHPPPKAAASLCHSGETTYFNCHTAGHKLISLCGSIPSTLQYRFGTTARVELAFPQDASEGVQRLRYAHYLRYQTDRTEVTFSQAGVDYALFDDTEDGRRSAGVRVTTADGSEHDVACVGAVHGRLNALAKSLPCDPDNALNGGSCP